MAGKTGTTSKYHGVTLFRGQGKYQAFVKFDGKRRHCGMWFEEHDAALARDRAVLHFKLDLKLNFPRVAAKAGPAATETLVAEARAKQKSRESSRYHGVSWDSRRGRWVTVVCVARKKIQIAQFDSQEDAALAYDRVALHLLGATTRRNFPGRRLKPANVDQIRIWARTLWKKKTSSRYRGVCWNPRDLCWMAQINIQGRHRSLGSFSTEAEAAAAYDQAATKAWGSRAALNFR